MIIRIVVVLMAEFPNSRTCDWRTNREPAHLVPQASKDAWRAIPIGYASTFQENLAVFKPIFGNATTSRPWLIADHKSSSPVTSRSSGPLRERLNGTELDA
jgi:hypothetical protein